MTVGAAMIRWVSAIALVTLALTGSACGHANPSDVLDPVARAMRAAIDEKARVGDLNQTLDAKTLVELDRLAESTTPPAEKLAILPIDGSSTKTVRVRWLRAAVWEFGLVLDNAREYLSPDDWEEIRGFCGFLEKGDLRNARAHWIRFRTRRPMFGNAGETR